MRNPARSRAAILLALLLLAPGIRTPAAADVLPDAETLLARSAAAAGPIPANFRETIVGDGTSRTTFARNADLRRVVDRGPIHTEDGVYRGAAWHQDANGVTVLDERNTGIAPPPLTTSSVRRVTEPVVGYLVETVDARGAYVREIIDAETLLVVRTERTEGTGTVVTSYSDFATFGARRLPTRWTSVDSRTNTTTTEARTDYSEGAVAEADVTVPAVRRDLVAFPAGARTVTLPSRFVRDRIYLQVTIGGRSLDFVLDTGEPGIAITEDAARELGLPLYNETREYGAGPFAQYETIAPVMTVGQLTMHDVVMTTVPPVPKAPRRDAIAGILGFDFLARLGVTIDYAGAHVVVAPAGRWSPPVSPSAVRVPVRLLNGVPMVHVALNGQVGERFVLDTGATTSLLVTNAFARGHSKVFVGRGSPEPYAGLGGSFDVNRYRVRDVAIERIAFRDINVLRAGTGDAYGGIDGLIGTSLLHFFTVDLHYADGTVYLTRNALEPHATRHDCSPTTIAWGFRASDCLGADDSDRAIAD